MKIREDWDTALSKEFFGKDYCPIATWVFCWTKRELWEKDRFEELEPETLLFKNPGFATQKIDEYFAECMSNDDTAGIEKLARLMEISKLEEPSGPKEKRRFAMAFALYQACLVSFPPFKEDMIRFLPKDSGGDDNAKDKRVRRFCKLHKLPYLNERDRTKK